MLGKTLTGRYKIVKQLGGGGFSQTFIAEDGHLPDRPICVIKQLKPASSQLDILRISRDLFDKEAKVLYRLGKHECIPSLLAHFEEDEEFFLAQELVEGDVLTQEIRNGQCLGEQYTLDFLIEILPTLDFVHRQQVIHRDIKPSNLIRRASDRKIVLIDFGAVKEVSTQPISQLGHTSSIVIGSPGYMPNEQYSGKTIYASDIYAIGMIALQALTGLAPNQIPEDPVTSEFRWHDKAKVTPTLANIIDRMVRFDFRQRFQSAQEVMEALQPLLLRSQAQTVFSAAKPNVELGASLPYELGGVHNESDYEVVQSVVQAAIQPPKAVSLLFTKELAFTETADDLEMCEDPIRSKKLICLVCTGILENDSDRLNNFSFEELLQDLYQQFPDIASLKEGLVNAVKTIAIPKQRQYLIVAKMVFNLVSKLYTRLEAFTTAPEPPNTSNLSKETKKQAVQPQSPEVMQVNHLVINAGSAQLVAPLEEAISILPNPPEESSAIKQRYEQLFADLEDLIDVEDDGDRGFVDDFADDFADNAEGIAADYDQEPDPDLAPLLPDFNSQASDVYTLVAYNIDIDPQQARLKKLLFYAYQDQWESDLRQLNSIDWGNLLRELVSFMPTFTQLTSLIAEAVQRVSKPAEYAAIADILISKLEPLYPEVISSVISSQSHGDQPNNKIPFDPQILMDLFDLRLELVRFTNPMRAKILLFSILYYPFNPDRDKWQDLRSHALDSLLRQLFYAYPSLDVAESMVWQVARSLTDAKAYEQSASYIIQVIKFLYEQLASRSMLHPAAGSLSVIGDTESTQASFAPSSDDDTCQFA